MKDAIADKNFKLTIVHADGDVKCDFLVGIFQVTIDTLFETQFVRGHFKTRFGVLVNIHFFGHKRLGHAKVSSAQLDHPGCQRGCEIRPVRDAQARKVGPNGLQRRRATHPPDLPEGRVASIRRGMSNRRGGAAHLK